MIIAVPFFIPLILPFEFTVATFVFEEVYVTFSLIPNVCGFSVRVLPFFIDTEDFTLVIPGTVTVTFTFFVPDVTVITAFPGARALITPEDVTEATFLSEDA